jgi:hypothetical protein
MEKINQNEIKFNDLIEKAREYSNKDLVESEYNINLAILGSDIDEQCRIQIWALKSYLHCKHKTENELLTYYSKALKHIQNKTLSKIDTNSAFCIIRLMYRCGTVLHENKNNYLAAHCMFEAKNIFEEKDIRTERESLDTLENSFSVLLKEIGADVKYGLNF